MAIGRPHFSWCIPDGTVPRGTAGSTPHFSTATMPDSALRQEGKTWILATTAGSRPRQVRRPERPNTACGTGKKCSCQPQGLSALPSANKVAVGALPMHHPSIAGPVPVLGSRMGDLRREATLAHELQPERALVRVHVLMVQEGGA